MDVYRLYNSFSNIISILNKDIDDLTLKDQLVYEDPLAIIVLSDYKTINKKLNKINSNHKDLQMSMGGGLKKKVKNLIWEDEDKRVERMKNISEAEILKDYDAVTQDEGGCNEASKDIFILVIKIVMVILLIIFLPIVPFIMVSYYSFKRLNAKLDEAVYIL